MFTRCVNFFPQARFSFQCMTIYIRDVFLLVDIYISAHVLHLCIFSFINFHYKSDKYFIQLSFFLQLEAKFSSMLRIVLRTMPNANMTAGIKTSLHPIDLAAKVLSTARGLSHLLIIASTSPSSLIWLYS